MGRHAAPLGAAVDPVVAAALARRGTAEAEDAGARHAEDGGEQQGSPVGWPGREGDGAPAGSPVGWPGSTSTEPSRAPDAAPEPERARGWRRLFGGRAA